MRFLPTILLTVVIIALILIPGSKIPKVHFIGIDKLVHIVLFFSYSIALQLDFKSLRFWKIFSIGFLFCIVTEVLQLFVEGRSFDFYDILADSIGLLIGIITGNFVIKLLSRFWPFNKF